VQTDSFSCPKEQQLPPKRKGKDMRKKDQNPYQAGYPQQNGYPQGNYPGGTAYPGYPAQQGYQGFGQPQSYQQSAQNNQSAPAWNGGSFGGDWNR
jgi:hypothetical protein